MGSAFDTEINPMSVSQAAYDTSRHGLMKVAAAGILTGVLTPLFQPLIDKIAGSPGDLRIALLAVPFAVLVFILVRRSTVNPGWAPLAAAVLTMLAFVCAVNAAIWVDAQLPGAAKPVRNIFAGFAGGVVGSGLMAFGLSLLPASPRNVAAWLPMLIVGTLAGALLAVDNALDLDLLSVLYPVWQAGVAAALAMALRRSSIT
jgi:hypothetical protein